MRNQSDLIALFPPELRTASVVPRWSVVWTLMRDTVANHSYFVAMYAYSVAKLIGWSQDLMLVTYLALTHDLDETITGDIVSPVKHAILDENRADDYIDQQMRQRLPTIAAELDALTCCSEPRREKTVDEAFRIVTVADRLDALLFLLGEQRLGNSIITSRIPSAKSRLYAAFMELPKVRQELDALWNTVLEPVIRIHQEEGGNGV